MNDLDDIDSRYAVAIAARQDARGLGRFDLTPAQEELRIRFACIQQGIRYGTVARLRDRVMSGDYQP